LIYSMLDLHNDNKTIDKKGIKALIFLGKQ
jgi:hypothetical protein